MSQTEKKIHIIGAGISGIAAAMTLKKAGYDAVIIESNHHVGGRVTTTRENQYLFDHGFQVLLDAYPSVQEFLNLDDLEVIPFVPGSYIFEEGRVDQIGDLRRDFSFALPTLFARVGTLKDKLLVLSLSRKLKSKSLDAIFESEQITTYQYLKKVGFSDKIITKFFKPFYSGIFLEPELQTSSRMFEFVFKMFAQGNVVIPKNGIGAIPEQMIQTWGGEVLFNTKVESVVNDQIHLSNKEVLHSDYTIIAAPASQMVANLPDSNMGWNSVQNLYFDTDQFGLGKPVIGLLSGTDCLVNNFHFLNDIFDNHKKVISVSVVKKHKLKNDQLVERVRKELMEHANIKAGDLLRSFDIPKALPKIEHLQYAMPTTETQLTEHIYLAGDHLSNASLNAAMLNGKAAALAVIAKIEGHQLV